VSCSTADRDGKPLVLQLTGPDNWSDAMTVLGFMPRLKVAGFEDLGVIIDNDVRRNELLALLDELFAAALRPSSANITRRCWAGWATVRRRSPI
jgi:hypothetical protein